MATSQKSAGTNLGIDPNILKEIYRQMARIHAVHLKIVQGTAAGQFQFTYWPMVGQEGIPASISPLLSDDDYMVTIYRGIHDQVAKGVDLKELFAEAMGRTSGVNRGKGGAPHISDPKSGSMLTTGIVGAGAPIATGLALANQNRGNDRLTIVNFGDGATSIGAVHEAMNIAGVWKLPVVFMCQNNQMGEYTPIELYTAAPNFAMRAAGYGFKGVELNGNDPIEMYNSCKELFADVRAGKGPVFIEAHTCRLGAHGGIGETNHLSEEDLATAKAEAPVPTTRALLIDAGICTEDEVQAMEDAAKREVEEAVQFAMDSPEPPLEELFVDVLDDPDLVPQRGHYPQRKQETPPAGETKEMSIAEAVMDAQQIAMDKSENVILLGEETFPDGMFRTNVGFGEKYGSQRVRGTPIAETGFIGASIGAALVGMRPIAELMFSDFTAVCMDQIANHAAKQRFMSGGRTNVPMTIRINAGGGAGLMGAQHSQSLESWLLHIPGLKVVCPSTPQEAKGLLTTCIWDDDPCVFLEYGAVRFSQRGEVPVSEYSIPIGVADIKRTGSDITLISYGWVLHECLAVAEELSKEGIDCEVIDLRSLMPVDYHTVLTSVRKTKRALVCHAAVEFCGLGSEIAATLNDELFGELLAPAQRLGAAHAPMAVSPILEEAQMAKQGNITRRVQELMRNYS